MLIISSLTFVNHAIAFEELVIPRSVSGDKGTYFLMNATKKGSIIETLHKRIGVDSIGYSRVQIDCKKRIIRELGYTDISPDKMIIKPTKWFELVEGSSKSDLVNFTCKKFS